MPELLGATNPVPGYDRGAAERIPQQQNPAENTAIQNVVDPSRVNRGDGRTEQQDSSSGGVRYDSNFQTFLQRLRETPNPAELLTRLLAGRSGIVVSSGMGAGIAQELSQVLDMLKMDPQQFLRFLKEQFSAGSRFGGALFALLRNAYARTTSDTVRQDILQFLKAYSDNSSTSHIEGNILRNLQAMADSMPASWAEKLREILAQLENGMAAGDRQGNLALLRQGVFPHMSSYVNRTHDVGTARAFLSLLALDVARYENGSEENLLDLFHQLTSYGTLKEQLGGIDDQSLLTLLRGSQFTEESSANRFAAHLAQAAAHALRGEGDAQTQEVFRNLVSAILINESVYMPVNHYLIPLEWEDRLLFSELWVDPDDQNGEEKQDPRDRSMKFLFKIDVHPLGLFDVLLTSRDDQVSLRVACPESVAPFTAEIEWAMSRILTDNGLTPVGVEVRKMDRPVTLTEVFPKLFEGKNSVNVKI